MTILIADDEPLILEGISQAVDWQAHGHEVCATAEDGISALELVRQHQPDIVITDIRMPGLDGLDLVNAIRMELPATRIIIVSAHEDFGYARRALREGVLDYLVKPLDTIALLEAVRQATREIENEDRREDQQKRLMRFEAESRAPLLGHLVYLAFRGSREDVLETEACLARTSAFRSRAFVRGAYVVGAPVVAITEVLDDVRRSSGPELDLLWQREEPGAVMLLSFSDEPEDVFRAHSDILLDRIEADLKSVADIVGGVIRGVVVPSLAEVRGSLPTGELARPQGEIQNGTPDGTQLEPKAAGENPLSRRAAAFVEEHLFDDVSLAHAAEELAVNPAYLSRLFKRERGVTFMEHLTQRKVDEAKRLLANTTLYSYEIADRLGYQNTQYFSRVFRARVGKSPQEYRRNAG